MKLWLKYVLNILIGGIVGSGVGLYISVLISHEMPSKTASIIIGSSSIIGVVIGFLLIIKLRNKNQK